MLTGRTKSIAGMIFLLGLLLLSYLNYQASQERQVLIGNRLYSAWSLEVVGEKTWEKMIELLPRNSRVFFEHTEDGNIRTFYQRGNWKPPMVTGNFFDGASTSTTAVVGIYFANQNEEYIEIGGVRYDIIGVIGAEFPSTLDRLVLLNALPENLPILNIVLDARGEENFSEIRNELEVLNRLAENTPEEFIGSQELTRVVRQNVIILIMILSVLLGYVYAQLTSKKSTAYYLIGLSRLKILFKSGIELLVLTFETFLVIFILDALFGQEVFVVNLHLYLGLILIILMSYTVSYLLKITVLKGENSND